MTQHNCGLDNVVLHGSSKELKQRLFYYLYFFVAFINVQRL